MKLIHEVTDSNFKSEVLESDIPVLVDFWAPWCAPCMMVTPILEAVAQKMDGMIKFAKVNTDENFQAASDMKVTAIPTLLLFKNGKEQERIVGLKPQDQLEAHLRNLIEK